MEPSTRDFEKLGVFYLGRERDMESGTTTSQPVLYDSKDLTTHAVVVGMTGSGKTGLCIGLLEEAGIDRIPSIVIDPKGDIANLLLTFPDLSVEEFQPWVDIGEAGREGKSPEEFAASEAARWKKGLADWDQDGERIRRLRDTVEMRVYTPGSSAGRPLTILKSFNAPGKEVLDDSDLFRERVTSAASGLLALLGIDADPIRSREHILISQILNTAWQKGKDLDLGKLIGEIQSPPFQTVGIMEVDTFYPAKDRMDLAMTMNNLLASPSFASWMEGEPLNIKSLLHTPEGKPCISILSIAHLNDAERMFFVTILLTEVLAWIRTQSGTSSLRAILCMDEIFGFFPPIKNPPCKQPMLTLLKQARAYGLGLVLATQNPVDLDYKGLGNTGTWFLGRLQTERDKARVIEGLEGAAAQTGLSFDRARMDQILAGLGKRVFLMNNVNEDQPVVFETRWAMSYLRGPMTRQEIQRLVPKMETPLATTRSQAVPVEVEQKEILKPAPPVATASKPEGATADRQANSRQLIPAIISQRFVEPDRRLRAGETMEYRPALYGRGRVHFVKSAYDTDLWEERMFLKLVRNDELPNEIWDRATPLAARLDVVTEQDGEATFQNVPDCLLAAKNYKTWEKELKEFLYRGQSLGLFRFRELKMTSSPGETEGEFRVRLETALSELRDRETEKLREQYAAKFQKLRDEIKQAEARHDKETAQYKSRRMESVLTVGWSFMKAVMGRRTRGAASVKSVGQASRDRQDMINAEAKSDQLQDKFRDMEVEFKNAMSQLATKLDSGRVELEPIEIPPRKSDISVEEMLVAWIPWFVSADGTKEPAWEMHR